MDIGYGEVKMLNLLEVVENVLKRQCPEKFTLVQREQNVLEVQFAYFGIVLYYSSYEFELLFDYLNLKTKKEIPLDHILFKLGCNQQDIPVFKYMSNEQVMTTYFQDYLKLILQNYTQLVEFGRRP